MFVHGTSSCSLKGGHQGHPPGINRTQSSSPSVGARAGSGSCLARSSALSWVIRRTSFQLYQDILKELSFFFPSLATHFQILLESMERCGRVVGMLASPLSGNCIFVSIHTQQSISEKEGQASQESCSPLVISPLQHRDTAVTSDTSDTSDTTVTNRGNTLCLWWCRHGGAWLLLAYAAGPGVKAEVATRGKESAEHNE